MRVLSVTVLLAALTQTATADVKVHNVWARATPPGSTVAAVYGELISSEPDELVSISTPAAERGEVHMTTNDAGMTKMRPLTSVAMPADKPVSFRSGAMHVMLIGLREPLKAGTSVSITFRFRVAPELSVIANVLAPDASEPAR
jgi:copper(I)-binding protein